MSCGRERAREPETPGGPHDLTRADDLVRPEIAGEAALIRVLGDRHERPGQAEGTQRGHSAEPEGAGTEHEHAGAALDAGGAGRMDGAGGRLDHHRRLVGEVRRHLVELTAVSDEAHGPAAAGVGAVAGLQTGGERPEGDPFAAALPALPAGCTKLSDATRLAAEHRLDDDSAPVEVAPQYVGNDLVAGHEREADDVLEVP